MKNQDHPTMGSRLFDHLTDFCDNVYNKMSRTVAIFIFIITVVVLIFIAIKFGLLKAVEAGLNIDLSSAYFEKNLATASFHANTVKKISGENSKSSTGLLTSTGGSLQATVVDPGIAAVYQAQAAPPDVLLSTNKTAEELIREFANKNHYFIGWDNEKKRFMAMQYAAFNTNNPATDRNFLIRRENALVIAILMCKADIIRFVETRMSASDQLATPRTDVYTELNEEYELLHRAIESQRMEVVKLLEQINKAEAEALARATTGDRIMALLDIAFERVRLAFDSGRIAADRREEFNLRKTAYLKILADYDDLINRAKAVEPSVVDTSSSLVSMNSQLPLTGATVIQQAESWNPATRQYELAVLMCWSAQLETAARSTLTGELADFGDSVGKRSLVEWLDGQDWGAVIGPRQFLDDQGRLHFLGVATRPVMTDASVDRQNRRLADVSAQTMAAFSLFADVHAFTIAKQDNVTITGDLDQNTITMVVESLQETLSQALSTHINGLLPLYRARVKHALSGQDMHVSVYGINARAVAAAIKMEEASRSGDYPHKLGDSGQVF